MNKHTKGPWELRRRDREILIFAGEDHVASVWYEGDQEAVASLIVAAPEMLEALEKAYGDIIRFLNEGDFKRGIEWDAGYIIDAIAKGKGEV